MRLLAKQFFNIHIGLFLLGKLQQRQLLEVKHASYQRIRKLLNANVVDIDGFVILLAPIGNAIFQTRYTLLQL